MEEEPQIDLEPYTSEELALREKVYSADYVQNLKPVGDGEQVTFGLFVIMRNESKIIEKMLNSVHKIIDYAVFCDTGSEDNTIEVVENFFSTVCPHIPIKVFKDKWHDFGHNRSLAIRHLWETFPMATYAFTIDCDMSLKYSPNFKKQDLKADRYSVIQVSKTTSYYNIRILKRGKRWISKGRTHECYDCHSDPYVARDMPESLMSMPDDECGQNKSSKFVRDLRLLNLDHSEASDYHLYGDFTDSSENWKFWSKYGTYVRSTFYIAQTYRSMGKFEESFEWYTKRAGYSNSYEEEGWFAEYSAAGVRAKMGRTAEAIGLYLKANMRRPQRAEPLAEAAELCRNEDDHLSAYNFATEAAEIVWPKDDKLFVDIKAHTWGPLYTLSISSYYLNRYRHGILSSLDLLSNSHTPEWAKKSAVSNLKYYLDKMGINGRWMCQEYLGDQEIKLPKTKPKSRKQA